MVALTDQGEVFFWGLNPSNERISEWPEKVTQNFNDRKAVAVTCSAVVSYALLEDGQLYSWGDNTYGGLGIGNKVHQSDPVRVLGLDGKTIKQLVCDWISCMVLTDCGKIFAWAYREIIPNNIMTYGVTLPKLIRSEFGKAVQIEATALHCMAKFDDGITCFWNSNSFNLVRIGEPFIPYYKFGTLDLRTGTIVESRGLTLNDEQTVDIYFQVGKKQIWVHKQILMQSFGYFDAMFQSHWIESKKRRFNISHFKYHTFYAFLYYIYTEQLYLCARWTELSVLADYYGHLDLQSKCLSKIRCHRQSHKRRHSRDEYERDIEWNKRPRITENEQSHQQTVGQDLSEAETVRKLQNNTSPAK